MTCEECGTHNPLDAKYCKNCGHFLRNKVITTSAIDYTA